MVHGCFKQKKRNDSLELIGMALDDAPFESNKPVALVAHAVIGSVILVVLNRE